MGIFEYYLIGVNIIGFFIYLLNMWLYSNTAEAQVDALLTIISLLGGSLGILLSILIFDRKAVKDIMQTILLLLFGHSLNNTKYC